MPYDEAKDIIDTILRQHDVHDVESEDDDVEAESRPGPRDDELKMSDSAKILRNLEHSRWIYREPDRRTGQDMIRFPRHAYSLIPALMDIKQDEDVEYDVMLMSISSLLSDDVRKVRKAHAVAHARRQMAKLIDDVKRLLQELASMRPEIERLENTGLSGWPQQFAESRQGHSYRMFKLRHSPDRWHADIVMQTRRLREHAVGQRLEFRRASEAVVVQVLHHPAPVGRALADPEGPGPGGDPQRRLGLRQTVTTSHGVGSKDYLCSSGRVGQNYVRNSRGFVL